MPKDNRENLLIAMIQAVEAIAVAMVVLVMAALPVEVVVAAVVVVAEEVSVVGDGEARQSPGAAVAEWRQGLGLPAPSATDPRHRPAVRA